MNNPINDRIIFCVSRLRATFDTGDRLRQCDGTGFWVQHGHCSLLVTNRHNVDPETRFEGAGYTFMGLEVELRSWDRTQARRETRWFSVDAPKVVQDARADCCVIVDPNLGCTGEFSMPRLPSSSLATATWFERHASLMDRVHFVGYPFSPTGLKPWWDTGWNVPIAREASLASLPFVPFENPLVKFADTVLVSGHSFGGCSGSPVVHVSGGSAVPAEARVVGIMSGHLGDKDSNDRAVHGGLSFFTRSTTIWKLIAEML